MEGIRIRIEGKTPLLCNRFTDEAQLAATSGTSSAARGDKGTPQQQAEKKLYRGADGKQIVIPTPNLLSCFTAGGKFCKSGRGKVTTQKSSLVPACLSIEGADVPIEHVQPWRVDARPVRIPATGGRILCYRPIFDDWALELYVTLDTRIMTVSLAREVIDYAAQLVGLGDFRPDCKGPFGRFVVTRWAVEHLADLSEAAE